MQSEAQFRILVLRFMAHILHGQLARNIHAPSRGYKPRPLSPLEDAKDQTNLLEEIEASVQKYD